MSRITIVFVLCIFLFASFSLVLGKVTPQHQLSKISENQYVLQENSIKHRLAVIPKENMPYEVHDTLSWYNPAYLQGGLPYPYPGDTVICNFKLTPDPAYLLKVRGIFGDGGQADFYVWQDGGEYPGPTVLANVRWDVTGSTAGQETWEELDFTPAGPDTIFLPWAADPDPANRPYFVIGYVCSGTNVALGGGVPDIYYDWNSTYPYGGSPRGHSWFTLPASAGYTGAWYGVHYSAADTWAQYWFEVVVNYYNGVSPFINSVSQLNDTWKTSNFTSVTAELVDIDGTINESWLFYQKNSDAVDSVAATSSMGDEYYYDIPGSYAAGDSISYWLQVTDNDGKTVVGFRYYFKVLEPVNPTAPILVVFNGLYADEADLALFWQPLLDDVIGDTFALSYETWDVEEHRGIDNSIVDHPSFQYALVFGFSVNSVPVEDYSGSAWENFVAAGKSIFLASSDYLFAQGYEGQVTFGAGDFIHDVFGVLNAYSDPQDALGSLGDQFVIGISGDPISNDWAAAPITFNFGALLGGNNWNDYASADPALTNAATLFLGVVSGEGNGVRNVTAQGGQAVYLPFNLSAIADTLPTGEPVIQNDANKLLVSVLEWFSSFTAIDNGSASKILDFELTANYPNPFNPSTTIEYALKENSQVSLVIYNTLGEKVKTLVSEEQIANRYQVTWDGTNDLGAKVASGVYLYRITAGNFVSTHKMILMK
jgi:hypothetical protein